MNDKKSGSFVSYGDDEENLFNKNPIEKLKNFS